jgi:hypothetical protein
MYGNDKTKTGTSTLKFTFGLEFTIHICCSYTTLFVNVNSDPYMYNVHVPLYKNISAKFL